MNCENRWTESESLSEFVSDDQNTWIDVTLTKDVWYGRVVVANGDQFVATHTTREAAKRWALAKAIKETSKIIQNCSETLVALTACSLAEKADDN